MCLIKAGMYLSSPADSRSFVIVHMETTTYIQEYQNGKANIPSQVSQVLMVTGSGASAETETIDSNTRQRIPSELRY
jgi:hypothetical protein